MNTHLVEAYCIETRRIEPRKLEQDLYHYITLEAITMLRSQHVPYTLRGYLSQEAQQHPVIAEWLNALDTDYMRGCQTVLWTQRVRRLTHSVVTVALTDEAIYHSLEECVLYIREKKGFVNLFVALELA